MNTPTIPVTESRLSPTQLATLEPGTPARAPAPAPAPGIKKLNLAGFAKKKEAGSTSE